MGRQYLACKFRPKDSRLYTYHNDGPPVACGDVVRVPDRSGDGWQRVTVHEIDYIPPPYTTKAILGRDDDPEPAPKAPPQSDLFG